MSEIIEHRYDGGNLFSRKYFKNGKLEGETRQWFQDGTLSLLEHWKDGKLEGVCKTWYENGQIREEAGYQNGIVAQYRSWHESGNPWVHRTCPDGEYKLWNQLGNLMHIYIRNDKNVDNYFSYTKKRIFTKLKKLFISKFSLLNTLLISDLEKTLYLV